MLIVLRCLYCDYSWRRTVYSGNSSVEEKCLKCNDSNISIKELDKTRIDAYIGCPPFPEKEEKKEKQQEVYTGFPFWSGD